MALPILVVGEAYPWIIAARTDAVSCDVGRSSLERDRGSADAIRSPINLMSGYRDLKTVANWDSPALHQLLGTIHKTDYDRGIELTLIAASRLPLF